MSNPQRLNRKMNKQFLMPEASMMNILEEGVKLKLEVEMIKEQFLHILTNYQSPAMNLPSNHHEQCTYKRKNQDENNTHRKKRIKSFSPCENKDIRTSANENLSCIKCKLSFQSRDNSNSEQKQTNQIEQSFYSNSLSNSNTVMKTQQKNSHFHYKKDCIAHSEIVDSLSLNEKSSFSSCENHSFDNSSNEYVDLLFLNCAQSDEDSNASDTTYCINSSISSVMNTTHTEDNVSNLSPDNHTYEIISDTRINDRDYVNEESQKQIRKKSEKNICNRKKSKFDNEIENNNSSFLDTCYDESFYENFISEEYKNKRKNILSTRLSKKIMQFYSDMKYKKKPMISDKIHKATRLNTLICLDSCIKDHRLKSNQTLLDFL